MGLFDRITSFVEDNATDVAMGFIGQLNTLDAEQRKLNDENADTAKKAAAARLKSDKEYFQSLSKTDAGRKVITQDWVNTNSLRLTQTGELENIMQVLADIEASKQHFGNEDTFLFSFTEGEKVEDTLNNINSKILKDPKVIAGLHDNDSGGFNKLIDYLGGVTNQYISQETQKASESYANKETPFNFVMNIGGQFKGISNNNLIVKALKARQIDFSDQAVDNMLASQAAEDIGVPKDNVVILKGPDDGQGNYGRVPITIPESSMKQLKNYVAYTGRKDIQAVIDDYWYKNQAVYEGVDMSDETAVESAIKEYYQPFIVAMEQLGGLGLDALDPDYKGPTEILSDDTKALAFQKLLNGGLIHSDNSPDSQAMRAALLPFMNSNLVPEVSPLGSTWIVKPKSEKAYFESRIGQKSDTFFAGMAKGIDATDKSIGTIDQLLMATEQANAVGSAAGLLKTFLGTFGKKDIETGEAGGFLSQLANSYGLEETDRTVVSIARKRIKAAGGLDTELGRAEALRVIAAFEMARAFDPSGRLSNMDVEMQLARLGGSGLQTVAAVKEQILIAKQDLEKKRKYYETFDVTKYSSTGVMTAAAQSRIDATIALMDLERTYMKEQYRKGYIYVDGRLTRREEGIYSDNSGTNLSPDNNDNNNQPPNKPPVVPEVEPLTILQGNPQIDDDNLIIQPNVAYPRDREMGLDVDTDNRNQLIYNYIDQNGNAQVEPVTVLGPNGQQIPAIKGQHFTQDTKNGTFTFIEQ